MFKTTRYLIIVLSGTLLSTGVAATPRPVITAIDAPADILFVGNSFTYYNNSLHNHLRQMMEEGGRDVGTIRSLTISGARLKQHAPAIRAQLDAGDWDVVILQGNSMEPVNVKEIDGFKQAVREYARAVHAHDAQTVLFMTWARTHLTQQTASLNVNYTDVGNETESFVVPVGLAFEKSTRQKNGIALRTADRRHPTLAGTYLAACTFYAALFGETPVGHGYTAGLDEEIAASLQAIAWETIGEYYGIRQ